MHVSKSIVYLSINLSDRMIGFSNGRWFWTDTDTWYMFFSSLSSFSGLDSILISDRIKDRLNWRTVHHWQWQSWVGARKSNRPGSSVLNNSPVFHDVAWQFDPFSSGPVANRPLLRSRRATRIGWPQRTSPKSSKFFWPRILMRRCVVAMTKSPRSWRHSKLCSVISPIWACCKQQQSRSYAPNNRIWSSSVFTGWQFMGWVWS